MIIGFGKREIDTSYRIMEECFNEIKANGKPTRDSVELVISRIKQKYHDIEKKYSSLDASVAPERYCKFYSNTYSIYDWNFFINFSFLHINRRYAFSPDGWACFQQNCILNFKYYEDNIFTDVLFLKEF